jgi:hypothetical protein
MSLSGLAPREGELWFRLDSFPEGDSAWLSGVGDFLESGLSDLARDFPAECEFRLNT